MKIPLHSLSDSKAPTSVFGKAFTLIVGVVMLVVGFMFSVVILAVVAAAGLAAWGYLWWKSRDLRRAMAEQRERAASDGGTTGSANGRVIDGEAVTVDEGR